MHRRAASAPATAPRVRQRVRVGVPYQRHKRGVDGERADDGNALQDGDDEEVEVGEATELLGQIERQEIPPVEERRLGNGKGEAGQREPEEKGTRHN